MKKEPFVLCIILGLLIGFNFRLSRIERRQNKIVEAVNFDTEIRREIIDVLFQFQDIDKLIIQSDSIVYSRL